METPDVAKGANAARFDGLADVYDASRPAPPSAIADVLCRYAGVRWPKLVVDIGCGTGLATRLWLGRAAAVVGVEPGDDMRRRAMACAAGLPGGEAMAFRKGTGEATGLADGCADIVTASQSLHWMDPEPTFAEVARILRPGGVFAALDADMTPSFGGPAEEALFAMRRKARALEEKLRLTGVRRWDKAGHLERMTASGRFRFTRQILAHRVEPGSGERLVGLALSFGGVAALLAHGVDEAAFGLDAVRREAATMGPDPVPFHWSYTVRLGVR
ncbi:Methyltransferase type 11 [Solidesulfovibrio carbinoliphilus subsp. oakridgensis]|uniref:Methyltransferase type 11 n=1 Tax=Solidesulfovibrio carbinoliphilus subsp. oakridgensis TaxID=694327 RepID=G7QDH2_9BACT|nr:class I SAM-dependent methyltransferase [Solidesulfovibrio carbinoliphilus]EHJ46478.1 Methyltransferase type 11 [Solidesulfovibrio carbinoliphilus subsp. oakridgensis]